MIHPVHHHHHHRRSPYAPRGVHLQASRQETRQSEAASIHARRTPTIPYGVHTKSTASRGRCRGGASCVSPSVHLRLVRHAYADYLERYAPSRTTFTSSRRSDPELSSCVCRETVKWCCAGRTTVQQSRAYVLGLGSNRRDASSVRTFFPCPTQSRILSTSAFNSA